MQASVLVTGAAGFLGSHLCERLVAGGYRVLGVDNLSSGDRRNLAGLLQQPQFELFVQDVVNPPPVAALGATRIFNLACLASPAWYQREPVQTVLASTQGAWQLLELARGSGARVLQASTSEVYGDPLVHPQPEGYWGHANPVGFRSCYDEGKRCAEALFVAYRRQYDVSIRIARLFNTYGPRLRPGDGRVVSNFIVQALQGKPVTIYGAGQQTRSFCYVDDTVEAMLRLMDVNHDEPLNIGNPEEHTVLELAEKVLSLTGSRSRLHREPLPPDDPQRRCPDISAARRALDWQPRVGLDEGLRRTIDHLRHELGLQKAWISLPPGLEPQARNGAPARARTDQWAGASDR
jgi:UDP-glucuronate decarboxylase